MDSLMDNILDFVRVAGVLTLVYLVYQYWGVLIKGRPDEDEEVGCRHAPRLSRSRSRSSSRSRSRSNYNYKLADKHRRGRKSHRRCPDCSLCNIEK